MLDIDLNNIESNIEDLTLKDLSLNLNGIDKFNSLFEYFNSIENEESKNIDKKYVHRLLNDNLFWFYENIKKIKKLNKNEEIQLFDSLRRQHNKSAYNQLILSNLYLVQKTAEQLGIQNDERMEMLDLIMEGVFGLHYAISKYNHLIANRFMSFVPMTIHRYIQRAKAAQSSLIKLPVHIYDNVYKINKVLSETFIDDADYDKLSDMTGLPLNVVTSILNDENNTIYYKEVEDKHYKTVIENIPDNLDLDEDINDKIILSDITNIINTLKTKERDVLFLRFGLDESGKERTLEEVGNLFGVTRERVRQIENKALAKLKQRLRLTYKYNVNKEPEYKSLNSTYTKLFKKDGISYIPDSNTIAKKVIELFKPQNENDFIEKFKDIAYSVGYASTTISIKYLKELYSRVKLD